MREFVLMSLINLDPLLHAIEQDYLILTPNSRLKNKLIDAYNSQQLRIGKTTWRNIRVKSVQEWLHECHQQLLDQALVSSPKALISSLQRQYLWQQIIESNNTGTELINSLRLATDADSTYTNIQRWNLDDHSYLLSITENTLHKRFVEWLQVFTDTLNELKLHTFEDMQKTIIQAYKQGALIQEPEVVTLGFGELSPLVRNTFSAISNKITSLSPTVNKVQSCAKLACRDRDNEAENASTWAKSVLETNQDARIGIIVPNLGQDRETLERHLLQTFEPHYLLPETNRYTLPFNFSTGVPLGSTPFIKDTLNLLKLLQHEYQTNTLISLLNSPFWGPEHSTLKCIAFGPDELDIKCQLIDTIKRKGRATLSATQFRYLVRKCAETQAKDSEFNYEAWLNDALQTIETNSRSTPTKQLPSRWIVFFQQQLEALNWPGQRRLDSIEYQQAQQWFTFLEDVCRLDQLQAPISCYDMLERLSSSANNSPFQAQTQESPIQVLGALEGAGLLFTDCWVMGMTDKDWPPTPQPSPLLSISVQRQHGMPHADAARELMFAETLTHDYQHCAERVIFSHATADTESKLQHSPLIDSINDVNLDEVIAQSDGYLTTYINQLQASPKSESVDVSSAPIMSTAEKQFVRGGSQILRNQAINPLAAFFIHRLGAQQPQPINLGFTPQQRGQILHDTLATFWTDIQGQENLLALDNEHIETTILSLINSQMLSYQQREPKVYNPQYLTLEANRQTQLIMQWLEQEKQRPAFTVKGCETPITANIAGLTLNLRLDRLDQLQTGELIIIDYKTGTPTLKQWGSDKPEEPQLPLYALTYEPQIQALMFVQINMKAVAMKGIGDLTDHHDGVIPTSKGASLDLPEDWQAMLEHWQHTLEQLSLDFQNGVSSNDFKTPALSRYYEHLNACLRTQEQQ